MGIQGLLPQLKSIMAPAHIKDLEGCSVAVDTYSWLHKGALYCGRELCKGIPTTRPINYCMDRVNLLRHYGVKPVLVFDGGLLPMKMEQENKRARSRKENLARASEHEGNGNSRAAFECYQKALDISPSIAHELILVLRRENISYIVAPYEADAQMAFLAISNQVDAVVTEDSDLIPYGCPRIIYKMDKFGQGVEFRLSKLQQNKELNFAGFTKQMLLEMCIFSGCDYLQSLPGMGVKTAHALIKKFRSYDRVIKHLKYTSISVPPEYEDSFEKAIMTFQHQRVYDPLSESIVNLTELPGEAGDDLEVIDKDHIAKGIAEGNLDPFTKMPFQTGSEVPVEIDNGHNVDNIRPKSDKKKPDLPTQENLLTQYFCLASPEAKRPFKTPGSTPTHSSPDDNVITTPPSSFSAESGDLMQFQSQESLSKDVKDILSWEDRDISCPLFHETNLLAANRRASSPLQQKTVPIHRPCVASARENMSQNPSDGLDGKTRSEKRKVIVRSSYFKQKQSIETVKDQEKENFQSEDDVPVSLPVKINGPTGTLLKRKTDVSELDAMETSKRQSLHADDSLVNHGFGDPNPEKRPEEKPDKKFGANISHLDHYSNIAGKSLERFVKVMDSFRFTGSGSRASGLRAPLKNVQNTRAVNRSTPPRPIQEFAYNPRSRKVAVASRRA
ncbi:hypothetical protein MLD38_039952 [Melastoma candidum]|uniref:Uncharacterized protein n=1 Tax=Melastoma candidum TaxID=119954 RepID=A0ACB9L4G7_9MYRT|nr:hypothetical protein MLD38_039952 [Melastoma candidum]